MNHKASEDREKNSLTLLTSEGGEAYPDNVMGAIDIDTIKARIHDAKSRMDDARRELRLWEEILSIEASRKGLKPESNTNGISVNKSETLRNFLKANRQGVTYSDIKNHFKESGISITDPYLYNLTNKWEGNGSVTKRDGKIFWCENEKASGQTFDGAVAGPSSTGR